MEMFQLVDKDGNPAGQATREECHGNPLLVHLVVHLHVLGPDGKLLLQRRSMTKDTNPGRWDTSVGGHVRAGEDVLAALKRETREELGIDATGATYLYSYLFTNAFEAEFARCFLFVHSGNVAPDAEEIDEVRFFTLKEIEAMVGKGSLTPMFEKELTTLRRHLGCFR
jgi:isopentenyl-diphosphate delta-isomerase type 1